MTETAILATKNVSDEAFARKRVVNSREISYVLEFRNARLAILFERDTPAGNLLFAISKETTGVPGYEKRRERESKRGKRG